MIIIERVTSFFKKKLLRFLYDFFYFLYSKQSAYLHTSSKDERIGHWKAKMIFIYLDIYISLYILIFVSYISWQTWNPVIRYLLNYFFQALSPRNAYLTAAIERLWFQGNISSTIFKTFFVTPISTQWYLFKKNPSNVKKFAYFFTELANASQRRKPFPFYCKLPIILLYDSSIAACFIYL